MERPYGLVGECKRPKRFRGKSLNRRKSGPSQGVGRASPPVDEHLRKERRAAEKEAAPPPVPAEVEAPGKIDKSQLAIGEPKRIRDKEHLKFVASKPCLICSRQPCDAHHLRFAQPRATGMKVSDEFTVPLCRIHHRNLHDAGNELAWWQRAGIAPLEIAKELWEESLRPLQRLGDETTENLPQSTEEDLEK